MKRRLLFFSLILCLLVVFSSCVSQNNVEDNKNDYTEEDARYNWIEAFINKDSEACVDLMFSKNNFQQTEKDAFLKRLEHEFERYEIKEYHIGKKDNVLILDFNVNNSTSDIFPDGNYRYEVKEGIPYVSWIRENWPIIIPDKDLKFFLGVVAPYYEVLSDKMAQDGAFESIAYSLAVKWSDADNSITVDNLEEAARTALRRDIEPQDNYQIVINSDGVHLRHPGGVGVGYEVIGYSEEHATISITCRFFADPMGLTRSDTVSFVFERLNGTYPYSLVYTEVIYDSGLPPYKWAS